MESIEIASLEHSSQPITPGQVFLKGPEQLRKAGEYCSALSRAVALGEHKLPGNWLQRRRAAKHLENLMSKMEFSVNIQSAEAGVGGGIRLTPDELGFVQAGERLTISQERIGQEQALRSDDAPAGSLRAAVETMLKLNA